MQASALAAVSNKDVLRALALAAAGLTVSALLSVAIYATYAALMIVPKHDNASAPQTLSIAGSELILRVGQGNRTADSSFRLTGFSFQEQAVITRAIQFKAENYSFLDISAEGIGNGIDVYLLWRTAEDPKRISRLRLQFNQSSSNSFYLAQDAQWQGQITEVGFDIYGDLRNTPVVLSGMAFRSASLQQIFATIWTEWTAYDGWTQSSAHFLRGTPAAPLLSPTLATALWCGFALLFVYVFRRFSSAGVMAPVAAAMLVPWIALDLYWQGNLTKRVAESNYLFAGKSQVDKHRSGSDAELYEYARHLTDGVLPEVGTRVYLLHDSEPQTYTRLRMQYHLLPHNLFNYDRFPGRRNLQKGDYILVFGDIPGLQYNAGKGVLRWGKNKLGVRLVDSHAQGDLYEVVWTKAE